jgi:hypothetical protein
VWWRPSPETGETAAPQPILLRGGGAGTAFGTRSSLKASTEGGGSPWARWRWARWSVVEKKPKGRGGGPAASQAASGERLGYVEMGNLGAR